ncbi:MAG: hypothetical protein OHK0046_51660 [Anaerolineae bacterium]
MIVDETGDLDQAAVQEGAQELVDRGAVVFIYVVNSGLIPRMNELLQENDLLQAGSLPENLIVIFLSVGDEFSFVRFGSQWASLLGSQTAVIRNQHMQPNLVRGDVNTAVLSSLDLMEGILAGSVQPLDRQAVLAPDYSPIRTVFAGIALAIVGFFLIRLYLSRSISSAGIDVAIYVLLTTLAVFSILPFVWMTSSAFKPLAEIFAQPPRLITENMNLNAFEFIFSNGVGRVLINTAVIATLFTIVTLFFATLAGFGFAKYTFPGRKALFSLLLAIMLVPGAVTIVPTYIVMVEIGWIDTIWPLVVPGAANAYAIFFMRQYIMAVPDELLDSARIDGCTEFGIFWRIITPLVAPGMTSLGLISFMAMWNSYLSPLIYLRSPENFTLSLYQMNIVGPIVSARPWPEWMAVGVISVVPTLIIYLMFQRRFTEGIAAGAVKS